MILEYLDTKIRLARRNNAGKKGQTSQVVEASENASFEDGQVGSFNLKAEAQLCPEDKRVKRNGVGQTWA